MYAQLLASLSCRPSYPITALSPVCGSFTSRNALSASSGRIFSLGLSLCASITAAAMSGACRFMPLRRMCSSTGILTALSASHSGTSHLSSAPALLSYAHLITVSESPQHLSSTRSAGPG